MLLTKPKIAWGMTGPPKWSCWAIFLSGRRGAGIVTDKGLLMISPMVPPSLCSKIRITAFPKRGPDRCSEATNNTPFSSDMSGGGGLLLTDALAILILKSNMTISKSNKQDAVDFTL